MLLLELLPLQYCHDSDVARGFKWIVSSSLYILYIHIYTFVLVEIMACFLGKNTKYPRAKSWPRILYVRTCMLFRQDYLQRAHTLELIAPNKTVLLFCSYFIQAAPMQAHQNKIMRKHTTDNQVIKQSQDADLSLIYLFAFLAPSNTANGQNE